MNYMLKGKQTSYRSSRCRSIISKEIGIPVVVQERKNSILCLSGQAPQSLAKHCKTTRIISYAKSIYAKSTENNIDNLI